MCMPAAREEFQRLMQRDGMVREFEYQVRQRNGNILWLSDSATVVRDDEGKVVRYEGTVRDITDQKRAEDAIAEGRRLLQQVIDTVPAVINVKDRNLRYVLMNRYMAGIFGIEPKEALGRTTTDLMSRYGAREDRRERPARAEGEAASSASTRRSTWIPPAICGNGWSTSCRCSMPRARSRTSSPSRSTSASASAASRRCARRAIPRKPRCAICARPRLR